MKHYVLEAVLDASFFKDESRRKKFHYRTRSEFVRFKSSPRRLKQNAALHLAKLRGKDSPQSYPLVTLRLYEEISTNLSGIN